MSIAERYAEFCAELRYDDLPPEVVETAKRVTLDTFGIAVGSVRADSTQSILSGTPDSNQNADGATVLATGEQMASEYAALVNGTLAHSLDFDDTHMEASLHPGAPVIPAALAAAEETDASGEELLTAIVGGYEVVCRLGMAVKPDSHYDRGFHGTGTCGVFGATAAAGIVYGFDRETFRAAFGMNGSQAAGSLQFLENGGWNKRVHPGFAAHSALLSTSFADSGFAAASEPIGGVRGFLQGYSDDPQPSAATDGLGEEYEILEVGLKPYPVCRYMHAPLDVLFELCDEEDINHADVEAVTVNIVSPGLTIVGDPSNAYPQSFVDAQFSMPFGAAFALVHPDADTDTFLNAVAGGVEDEIKRIIDVTEVSGTEWVEEAYPEMCPAEVTVETATGTYSGRTDYAKGEPENPLSSEELVEKYEDLTDPVLGEERATQVREAIADLESIPVAELVRPFARTDD